jgi:hypothetical protein
LQSSSVGAGGGAGLAKAEDGEACSIPLVPFPFDRVPTEEGSRSVSLIVVVVILVGAVVKVVVR